MNADWSEMLRLAGRHILVDTVTPTKDWMEGYIPSEDQGVVREAIDKAIREKSIYELEHRIRRRDGSLGWTRSRGAYPE